MTEYQRLRNFPPVLEVKKDAREVIIHIVSVMCDNKYLLKLKKNSNNEFRLDTQGQAFSNFQMKCNEYEIEWASDEGDWSKVFEFINSGVQRISQVKSR